MFFIYSNEIRSGNIKEVGIEEYWPQKGKPRPIYKVSSNYLIHSLTETLIAKSPQDLAKQIVENYYNAINKDTGSKTNFKRKNRE